MITPVARNRTKFYPCSALGYKIHSDLWRHWTVAPAGKNPLLSSKDGPGAGVGGSMGNSVAPIGMGAEGACARPARKNQAVAATGHTLSDKDSRLVLCLLKVSTWMGLVSLVVMTTFLIKNALETVGARKALWTANAVLGSLCVVILLPCVAWYVLCLVHVKRKGCGSGHRDKWDTGLNTVLFFSHLVSCVFYLVPNAMALVDVDGKVKASYVAWAFFIRLTMWNNIYFIFMVRSRLLNPWIDSKGKPVGEQEDSLLVDAPFWKHWYLPIPWLVYQGILVRLVVRWVREAKRSERLEQYIGVDGILTREDVLCEDSLPEETAVIAIGIALIVYQLIGVIFCYRGYRKLRRVSYNLYRRVNITLLYHLQHIEHICFIVTTSFVFMYFMKRESCVKQVLLCFGLLPAQFLMTMQTAINCIVAAPAAKEYREEEVDPNRLIWIERPVSQYDSTLDRIEHTPQFCFETALRTCLWSEVTYEYPTKEQKGSIDPEMGLPQQMMWGMKMYGLTKHVDIEENECDSQVLIAWSNETVVLSFRGTASGTNALTDVKAWMEIYPSRKCMWLPGIRSAVHAGFAHSWGGTSLKKDVLEQVEKILGDIEFDRPKSKIIVTGHSLGGAMAILAAYDIAVKLEQDGILPKEQVMCYTFGAPRVGNAAFAAKFNSQVPNTWQVINDIDVIPTLPKFGFLYRHVGHKAIINQSGDLIVNPTVAEFSMRMWWSFFNSIIQVHKHYLEDYKESFGAILLGRGRGLRGGDEAVPEILNKNDTLVCEVFEVSSGDPTSS